MSERWWGGKEGVRQREEERRRNRQTDRQTDRGRDVDRRKNGLLVGLFVICKISQALHHYFYTVVYLCER